MLDTFLRLSVLLTERPSLTRVEPVKEHEIEGQSQQLGDSVGPPGNRNDGFRSEAFWNKPHPRVQRWAGRNREARVH